MRVLGVDPGLTRCGLGVVEGRAGKPLVHLHHAVTRTPSDLEVAKRLVLIAEAIQHHIEIYRPQAVAIERVFSQHNTRTVMGVAQASGVVLLHAAQAGVPVFLYTPSEVKAAVTGSGRADKAQVQLMVARVLRLPDPPTPADAADALAIATCHIWRGAAVSRYQQALAAAGAKAGGR
ncbi:crossover junction endodeoxyribonuclease RuvC [Blastococcus sp. Marseille-P5729]|uniref:crossover junction endodeoxyribonuclease RuvC n=1 Tax=Blastococcus sp. Marseille-P5729 TaxID=2086582 RepID=UPI000D0E3DC9|nr:crossover junction endodeoxyribonuclease RuvC [Blastococcus sp. Marseille-P5729]